jgi:sulfite exporter TauE/SafE
MQASLAGTALLMGLVGGPHCVAMCGAACAGLARRGDAAGWRKLLGFQVGRLLGYSSLGGLAGASMQGMGWLTVQSAALRPVWSLFHVAMAVMGLVLMWQARQPVWLEQAAQGLWRRTRALTLDRPASMPLIIGVVWAFLPCGLLYSALLVAGLSGQWASGATVMALFAVGSGVSMLLGPWLWLRLQGRGDGSWGVRLAGLALTSSAVWALWMAYAHNAAPWCVTP